MKEFLDNLFVEILLALLKAFSIFGEFLGVILILLIVVVVICMVLTLIKIISPGYDKEGHITECIGCNIKDCDKYSCKFHPDNRVWDEKKQKEVLIKRRKRGRK